MSLDQYRFPAFDETLNDRAGSVRELSSGVALPRVRSILVPLDGSCVAEHAVPTAMALARRAGARLRLIYVHSSRAGAVDPMQMLTSPYRERELLFDRIDYLGEVIRRIDRTYPVPVSATVVRSQRVEQTLRKFAEGSDMVVMATRKRAWWKTLTGSVVQRLSQQVRCPLLTVRGHRTPAIFITDPIPTEIVVPLDGTAGAEQIVATAAALARVYSARLTLLHVRPLVPSFPPRTPMRYLEKLAMPLRASHPVRTLVIESNGRSAAQAIHSYLKVCDGALLAMTTPHAASRQPFWRLGTGRSLIAKYQGPLLLGPQSRVQPATVAHEMQMC